MIGVAIHFKRGQEQWRTELLSAAECAELPLGSGIFPPEKTGRIIRQISDLGEVREDICMTDEQARALKLTRF